MIHWVGLLIASAGATATLKWPNIQNLLKPGSKRLSDLLTVPASPSERVVPLEPSTHSNGNDKATIGTRSLDEIVKASDSSEPESNHGTRRLLASTGAVGLAMSTHFAAPWLVPISLFTTGALAAPIFAEAYTATVKERKLKVDVLDTTVISLCLLFGKVGPAAFMVWILDLADILLEQTTRKSRKYMTEVFGKQARYAWLLVEGREIQVPVRNLNKGDQIVVGTGDQVPVDGVVIHGDAMIDQQSLTGEAAPAEKRKGDQVFAMTVVVAGKIQVEVVETGENTLAAKILQIVNDAANYKVEIQSMGERKADQMVLPTLGLGLLSYLFKGTGALLATINADYGTGIRVAAPIALLASLGNAAKNGILVKDSQVFELLPDIDVVLFDKTGTLTYDVPIVCQIVPAKETIDPEQILFYTAAAEQKFTHPIASAILQKAEQQKMKLPALDESHYHVGFGIEVSLDGSVIKVGSSRYMEREGIEVPPLIQDALQQSRALGHSAILMAIDNEVAGMIEMQSTPREEATRVINFLKARGVSEIVLISGDHEAPTQELARQLGINKYVASVLPHEKAEHVRAYQEAGKKVMMVGDGINDSAALSLADVSVSLKGASTIAVDVADVIFMDGSLKQFEYLYTVTDTLNRNVRHSFLMIVIPNTVCIAGAMVGIFGLSSSLILNNGFNFLAALNSMRPLIGQDNTGQNDLLEEQLVAETEGEAQA
jgi:Cu2+-exporting ATPase